MLDNNDIKKLKDVFATKDDLKQTFVTKEEFESFMEIATTKSDVQNLATKDDLNKTNANISKIAETLGNMDKKLDEVVQISKEVEYIRNTLGIPALKKI